MKKKKRQKLSPVKGKRNKTVGLVPGTLVYTGNIKNEEISINFYQYNESYYKKETGKDINKIFSLLNKEDINWININGIHDVELIEIIGKNFKFHSLLLEDILSVNDLPKYEEYEDCLFFTLKMISIDNIEDDLNQEHVSLILGKNYVISFQEKEGDVFDIIRSRIELNNGRVRMMKADYLFYLLIDTVVDNYYHVLDKIESKLEDIEDELSIDENTNRLTQIIGLRKKLINIKKAIYPLREAARKLINVGSKFITEDIHKYINDLQDHVNNIIQEVDVQREIISGFIDLNNTNLNTRMNTVMKQLTTIATIFIPLTFIAGIYGMNFKFMPETDWKFGYPFALGLMAGISIIMLVYMKKKKWF